MVTYNLVGQRFNGTCLDYLAESFMAGNPLQGGGFVILNGLQFDDFGGYSPRKRPFPSPRR